MTVPVKASEITEAKIGPTHGVHNRPTESPIRSPPPKPDLFCDAGINEASRENKRSRYA